MSDLDTLVKMEKRYAAALAKIRDLIGFLQDGPVSERNGSSGKVQSGGDVFKSLTKGNAAEELFNKFGDMPVEELFSKMKTRNHPVASDRSLRSMLSSDSRFVSKGKGRWGLKQPGLEKILESSGKGRAPQ